MLVIAIVDDPLFTISRNYDLPMTEEGFQRAQLQIDEDCEHFFDQYLFVDTEKPVVSRTFDEILHNLPHNPT